MRSPNRPYLPVLDALRGLAAVLVALYHGQQLLRERSGPAGPVFDVATQWTYSSNPAVALLAEGHTGVALFLVLSGFVLTHGSLHRDIDTGRFLRNRALRILPLLGLVLLLSVVTTGSASVPLGLLQTLLGFGTLPGGHLAGPFALLTWTVVLEVQCYLLLPLLLRGTRAGGAAFLVKLVVGLAVLRTLALATAAAPDLNQVTYYSLAARLDQFLLGMLAAVLLEQHRAALGRKRVAVSAAAALVVALWSFNQVHGYAEPGLWRSLWVDLEGACWALLVLSLVALAPSMAGLPGRLAVWVGVRSYSLYLLHMPVVFLLAQHGWLLQPTGAPFLDAALTGLLLALPLALALSALSFEAVERPFLQLRRRDDRSATPAPAPAGP